LGTTALGPIENLKLLIVIKYLDYFSKLPKLYLNLGHKNYHNIITIVLSVKMKFNISQFFLKDLILAKSFGGEKYMLIS